MLVNKEIKLKGYSMSVDPSHETTTLKFEKKMVFSYKLFVIIMKN